jgi:shikimate dehydrogenase
MRRYALIGYPIAGSQSPALFASAGIPGRYELFENPDFEAAWEAFLRDYDAVNVTAPFKEKAFSRADILSPRALRCGAVNLLRKGSDGKVWGFNTDVDGVLYALSGIPAFIKAIPKQMIVLSARTTSQSRIPCSAQDTRTIAGPRCLLALQSIIGIMRTPL